VDNKYRLAERIGGGGMGDVFRAEGTNGGRMVAIKFLHPELAQNMEVAQRFFQEAQAVTKIRHPNVVEVLDAGTGEMGPYIVMEYLDGESVGSALNRVGRFEVDAVVATAVPVLEALDAAHRVGIIHRDLKPENIFLAFDSARGAAGIRLLDFGIAKVLDQSGPSPRTRTGVVFGTPDYLSPEQATGDGPLDGRSDLFAVGVLIYELLTGLRPFRAPTAVATAFKVVHAEAPSIAAAGVHVDNKLEALVHRLLQKEPSRRFPAALEVIRELDKITPDAHRRAVALARIVGAVRRLAQGPATLESERNFSRDATGTRHIAPSFDQAITQPVSDGATAGFRIRAPAAVGPPDRGSPTIGLSERTLGEPMPRVGTSRILADEGGLPRSFGGRAAGDAGRALWPGDVPRTVRSASVTGDAATPDRGPSSTRDASPPRTPSDYSGAASSPALRAPLEPSLPDGGMPAKPTGRPFPSRHAGRFQVRGPVLASVDKVIRDVFGSASRDEVIEAMPDPLSAELRAGSINALVAYPLEALDAYMERATAILLRDPGRWREFGRLAVDGELYNVVRTLLRPSIDVGGVIRRGISTWARLFSFGAWRVGAAQNGKVALTIGELDAVSLPLRLWMVGVIEQTTRRAVRADLRVMIVEGDHDFVPEMLCEIG
jgi:serine/threonine-protein kinase